MSIAKEPYSRFRLSQPIINGGIETFGLLKKFPFLDPNNLNQDDVITVNITHEFAGKPWAIANSIYNSPVLDWVIVLFNKPLNPVNWPHIGSVIKAPVARIVLPNV
jgi:hypothetical protein